MDQDGTNENDKQTKTSTGLNENVAGLLCYLLGIVTGIVFLIIEKENRFTRFHAFQSIFISAVFIILNFILGIIPIIGWLLGLLLTPIGVILWLVLMYKAYQGRYFKLPFLGDLAEKQLK